MARRRRKTKGGPEQVVIAVIGMVSLLLAMRMGGGPGAMLRNALMIFLALGIVAVLALIAWKISRKAKTLELSSPPPKLPLRRSMPKVSTTPQEDSIDRLHNERVNAARATAEKVRPTEWSLETLQAIEWKRFEELCEGFWKAKGYPARLTGPGADGGVDVVISERSDPSKAFAIIQCKAWGSRQVGVETVRALWGAKDHFSAKLAIFYGLSGFSADAQKFAAEKHLKLVSGEELLAQIKSLDAGQQNELLAHVTRGDYTTPTCPKCDIKMVRREGGGGKSDFWGCKNFRRCGSKPISVRA